MDLRQSRLTTKLICSRPPRKLMVVSPYLSPQSLTSRQYSEHASHRMKAVNRFSLERVNPETAVDQSENNLRAGYMPASITEEAFLDTASESLQDMSVDFSRGYSKKAPQTRPCLQPNVLCQQPKPEGHQWPVRTCRHQVPCHLECLHSHLVNPTGACRDP